MNRASRAGARHKRLVAAVVGLGVVAVGVLVRRMSATDAGRFNEAPPPESNLLAALAEWQPARPKTSLGRFAAYAWAAPLSLVGAVLGCTGRAKLRVHDGVVVCSGTRGLIGVVLQRRGFQATTLGHVVVTVSPSPSDALIRHELLHTRQAERMGVLFGPVYVGLLARYGYQQHPMERAARRAAANDAQPPSR